MAILEDIHDLIFESQLIKDKSSYTGNNFLVPAKLKNKINKLNPKTNRMKNFKTLQYFETDIKPEDRTFDNLPRYANEESKVKFTDWLQIKKPTTIEGLNNIHYSWGKGCDNKFYGWSHRAIYGFGIGDKVTTDTCGNDSGKEYVIKDEKQAAQTAINFARDVS